MKTFRLFLLTGLLLATSGFQTSEIAAERKAQESLPQAKDEMWTVLRKCKVHYDPKKYTYSIDFTPEVKAMEGKPITISGFMMPIEPKETFNHFLLSKRTPTCPFCPPGEPNEIAEVFTKKPVKYDEGIVIVTGTFKFTSNPDLGLFFQLKDSEMMSTEMPKAKNKASGL